MPSCFACTYYGWQTKLREGVFRCVCLSTGGCSVTPWNQTPRDQTPPPPGPDRHPPYARPTWKTHGTRQEVTSYTPPQTHKSGRYTSYWNAYFAYWVGLPTRMFCLGALPTGGGGVGVFLLLPGVGAYWGYATAAVGMHPTGMHSCIVLVFGWLLREFSGLIF